MSDIFNIIIKELNNSATESELKKLQAWLEENHENITLKNQFLAAWKNEYIDLDKVELRSWEKINNGIEQDAIVIGIQPAKSTTNHFNKWQKIAATVIFLLVSLFSYTYFFNNKLPKGPVAKEDLKYILHTTKLGEQKEIVLADSSIVILKGGSELKVPALEAFMKERRVKLLGQAYFNVNASVTNPFIVVSNTFNSRVTGTIFNINDFAQDDEHEVTVLEGEVQVSFLSTLDKSISVSKNEMLTYSNTSKSLEKRKTQIGIDKWADGNLVFDRDNFKSIVLELQRYFNKNIKVNNQNINQEKSFVGVFFKDESINEVLEVLSTHYKFLYKIKDDEIIIE